MLRDLADNLGITTEGNDTYEFLQAALEYSAATGDAGIFDWDGGRDFKIYVNRNGEGHVGLDDEQGNIWDYGRYNGQYDDQLSGDQTGPALLVRSDPNEIYEKMEVNTNGAIFHFDVNSELDLAISDLFSDNFNSYLEQFSENVAERMPEDQEDLDENERYAEEDWQITGPNCVTYTFDTLNSVLEQVIENSNEYSPETIEQAESVLEITSRPRIDNAFIPESIYNRLNKWDEEYDIYEETFAQGNISNLKLFRHKILKHDTQN